MVVWGDRLLWQATRISGQVCKRSLICYIFSSKLLASCREAMTKRFSLLEELF
ncbi:hypothetical protein H6G97_23830 [Nostoc flagelliforme FACHB-838]|uniref:Transposase n=1 Tax=Nostoc flagelliforme FACHB-838 TaxID=2692904 RepID=A0ABR8DSM7_9NOSO|nr:hypothetical protein [Nostoc flagelliforme]MBD2532447.1 hypothetical protein [Nostoc flagelliforme FACHB-838]